MQIDIESSERAYRRAHPVVRIFQNALPLVLAMTVPSLIATAVSPESVNWQFAALLAAYIFGIAFLAIGVMRLSRIVGALVLVLVILGLLQRITLLRDDVILQETIASPQSLFSLVFHVYVALVFALAGLQLLTLKKQSRSAIAETASGSWLSVAAISKALGFPVSLKHIKKMRLPVVGLFAMSAVGYSLVGLTLLMLPLALNGGVLSIDIGRPFTISKELSEQELDAAFEELDAAAEQIEREGVPARDFTSVAILLAMLAGGLSAGAAFRNAGRRLSRSSLATTLSADSRPPVLFLRAFGDDQVRLRRARWQLIGYAYEIGNLTPNLDLMLLEEGTEFGPVVALGNPKDPIPPYGAARGYFKDSDWQKGVTALAEASSTIVICLDEADGVFWEVELLARPDLFRKTLFVMHPRYSGEAGRQLADRVAQCLALPQDCVDELTRDPRTLCGFHRSSSGKIDYLRSKNRNQLTYVLMLRHFLRRDNATAI